MDIAKKYLKSQIISSIANIKRFIEYRKTFDLEDYSTSRALIGPNSHYLRMFDGK
jgi:glutaredoxin-related protein